MPVTDDFFGSRLDQLIDLRHPLAVLANRMPWHEIEASLAHRFARQVCTGKQIENLGLFGPTVSVADAGVSNAGRLRLPTRLMISLLCTLNGPFLLKKPIQPVPSGDGSSPRSFPEWLSGELGGLRPPASSPAPRTFHSKNGGWL